MKIAISSMENHLDAPFDFRVFDAPYLLIINTDTFECEEMANFGSSRIGRTIRSYIQEIVRKNVKILITGYCSEEDIEDFFFAGIKVYHGREDSVRDIVKAFNAGRLPPCVHSNYLHNEYDNKSFVHKRYLT